MEYKDYYKILGVGRDATQAQIKKAFRKLAREYHPDATKGDPAKERRFKEINEAHAVLSDPEKRKKYDALGADWEAYERAGAAARGGAGPFAGGAGGPFARGSGGPGGFRYEFRGNVEDLQGFSEFFRTFFGGGNPFTGSRGGTSAAGTGAREESNGARRAARSRRQTTSTGDPELDELLRGLDVDERQGSMRGAGGRRTDAGRGAPAGVTVAEAEAEISLEEAFHGTKRLVQVDDRRVEVTIPAGVRDGQGVRLRGVAGTGAEAADVVVRVRIRDHPVFTRSGDDLHRELPVTLEEALLGAEVPVETLKGRVLLRIPPETQNGRTFRLAGQGMPRLGGERAGDLYVKVRVVLPRGLDEEAKRRLRAFAERVRQPDPRSA